MNYILILYNRLKFKPKNWLDYYFLYMLMVFLFELTVGIFALSVKMNSNNTNIKVTKLDKPVPPSIKKSIQDKKKWIEDFQSQSPKTTKIDKSKRYI